VHEVFDPFLSDLGTNIGPKSIHQYRTFRGLMSMPTFVQQIPQHSKAIAETETYMINR